MKIRRLGTQSTWIIAVLIAQMPLALRVPVDSLDIGDEPAAIPFTDPHRVVHNPDRQNSSSVFGDGHVTTIRAAGGVGSYTTIVRDCEYRAVERHRHRFQDFGVEVNHRFQAPLELGIRAGYVDSGILLEEPFDTAYSKRTTERNAYYVNPYIGPEFEWFGLGVGVICASDPMLQWDTTEYHGQVFGQAGPQYYPSGHLRIGSRSAHLSIKMLEGLPVCSGGGALNLGFGWQTNRARGWAGVTGGGIYDGVGGLLRLSFDPSDRFEVGTNLRFGFSEGSEEYGVGLVLGWLLCR